MHIVLALGLVAVTGLILFWVNRPQPVPIIISTPVATAVPVVTSTFTPSPLRVYVTGAVNKPDVYILPPGSIVKDAIAAAGGTVAEADLEHINLALELYDQQQIYVPRQGETALPPVSTLSHSSSEGAPLVRININQASAQELETLPGIGPAIAQRIVEYRESNGLFVNIEDIMKVKGIGPSTFAKFKDQITTQ